MSVKWNLQAIQDTPARYSVEEIRRVCHGGEATCGGVQGQSVFNFTFDQESDVREAEFQIRANLNDVKTTVEPFETVPALR